MSYIVNQPLERTLYLTMAGVPVSDIAYNQITVNYKKDGQLDFVLKPLQVTDWINQNNGIYTLKFSASDIDTVGNFVFKVEGAGFDNLVFDQFTIIPLDGTNETPGFVQDQPAERTLFLALNDIPAPDVLPTEVTVKYRKTGQNMFSIKEMQPANWINLGAGYYIIKFSAEEMSRAGNFVYTATGSKFNNLAYDEFQILPPEDVENENICVLTGTLKNYSNTTPQLLKVVARPVEFPAGYDSTILSADQMYTVVDTFGRFSLPLVRNSIVIIEIARAGIRHQVTIPDQATVDLKDILPPFAVDFTV